MSPDKDGGVDEAIARAATEWFVAHRQGDLTHQERIQYLQWLKASPRHIEAYLKVAGMAGKLPEALGAIELDLEERLREATRRREDSPKVAAFPGSHSLVIKADGSGKHRRLSLVAGLSLSALVVLGLVTLLTMGRGTDSTTVIVPVDQQRFLTFEDGSVARLDSNTRVRVVYSHTRRLIELLSGQGLFTVTHDARRPFIVRTAGQDIVALGTQFDVSRRGEHVEVTVVEGKVEIVGTRIAQGAAEALPYRAPALQLATGQQVRIGATGTWSAPTVVDTGSATAWTEKAISFADSPLESVAEEFAHHTGARISIGDVDLRGYKVSGVFQAYDLESFVEYLQQLPGVTVTRGPNNEVRVSREWVDNRAR